MDRARERHTHRQRRAVIRNMRMTGFAPATGIRAVHDYNVFARAYWWTVAAAGATLLAIAIAHVASLPANSIYQILLAIGFVSAVALFPVRIPGTKLSVAGGEIFIFLALLLFGIEAAALAAAIEGAIGAARMSRRWTSWFGTPAMASITVWISGSAFVAARGAVDSAGLLNGATHLLLLTGLAALYCALSNLLPSALLAIKNARRLDLLALVADNSWMAVAHVFSAAIAGGLYYAGAAFGVWVAFAAAPTIILSMSSAHFLFERADSERRAQAALLEAAQVKSQRAQAHAAELERSQARFHGAFTNAAIGMALVSVDGQIRQVNPAVCTLLGHAEGELRAMNLSQLLPQDDYILLQEDMRRIAEGTGRTTHRELSCLDRRGNAISIAFTVAYFGDGTHDPDLIVQMQDIRERKAAEAQLLQMAFHDTLTGLPNRIYFRQQLAKALTRFKRNEHERFALMFLDFDRFKAVNDSLGHAAGDQLLIGFSTRIKAVLRASDTVARLGGDEFAVLVEDVTLNERVIELAQRIQDSFKAPFDIEGTRITSSASIGIAFGSARYESPDEVIRDADLAMYEAKTAGKARYAVFDPGLHDRATAELQLENELRLGIERGELRLHYQAQYRLADRSLLGYEALVRWQHPKRGLLYPDAFLPGAEETGLIVPLGRWVIGEVCRQLAHWRETEQGKSLRIAVNVSDRELRQEAFARHLLEQLAAHALSPGLLSIELGESALVHGNAATAAGIEQLRAAGVAINIDSFGSGLSSLAQLASLPIDGIKIDREFAREAGARFEAREIVRALASFGKALGKKVHVQGIETEEQWRTMHELGCDVGQGNLAAPPVAPEQVSQMLGGARLMRSFR